MTSCARLRIPHMQQRLFPHAGAFDSGIALRYRMGYVIFKAG
jgi:hypothetical protein